MRLLLAEDERALSRAVRAILERSRYTVDAAYDGEEALDFLEACNYDGIILDIMMPKKSGLEVLETIRRRGDRTPVLLLTAKAETEDKVTGLDAGANDYLTKPFDARELLARIRAMTRSQTEQATSRLTFGNIALDRATFELSSPTGSFRLANKEFQMLELFMCNPRQLISTERFMERIWGYESDADLSVVWVYISYLRKKLAALGADIQIRATRGAGYSLEKLETKGKTAEKTAGKTEKRTAEETAGNTEKRTAEETAGNTEKRTAEETAGNIEKRTAEETPEITTRKTAGGEGAS